MKVEENIRRLLNMHNVFAFDLDGTLIYSFEQQYQELVFLSRRYKLKLPMKSEIKKILYGSEKIIKSTIQAVWPNISDEVEKEMYRLANNFSKENNFAYIKPQRGVKKFLQNCRRKKKNIIIITNSGKKRTEMKLRAAGILNLIDVIYSARNNKKPSLAVLKDVYKKFSKGDILYFGDLFIDIVFTRNAGLPLIFVNNCVNRNIAKKYNIPFLESFSYLI